MDFSRYHRITLLNRSDVNDQLAVFRFRAEETIHFTPGQYATIGISVEGRSRPLLRPYSIASAPGTTDLEFFIEHVDGGQLTPHLWALSPGDDAWMRRKVAGRLVLDDSVRHHVMMATVTGVTPYVSIIRNQLRALEARRGKAPHQMLIVHGASVGEELARYRRELATVAAICPWLAYVSTISRPWNAPSWTGERGRVEDVVRKHVDAIGWDPERTAAYACGHPQMIDKVQGILYRAGFDANRIHEEKYFVERSDPE